MVVCSEKKINSVSRQLNWKNFTCTLTGRKTISIKDIASDTTDQLDFPNRIIQIAMGHGHLVAVTAKQCYIHSSISWNTPVIFDLKEGNICLVHLSERFGGFIKFVAMLLSNLSARLDQGKTYAKV